MTGPEIITYERDQGPVSLSSSASLMCLALLIAGSNVILSSSHPRPDYCSVPSNQSQMAHYTKSCSAHLGPVYELIAPSIDEHVADKSSAL